MLPAEVILALVVRGAVTFAELPLPTCSTLIADCELALFPILNSTSSFAYKANVSTKPTRSPLIELLPCKLSVPLQVYY